MDATIINIVVRQKFSPIPIGPGATHPSLMALFLFISTQQGLNYLGSERICPVACMIYVLGGRRERLQGFIGAIHFLCLSFGYFLKNFFSHDMQHEL